jgi:hypothetical protein
VISKSNAIGVVVASAVILAAACAGGKQVDTVTASSTVSHPAGWVVNGRVRDLVRDSSVGDPNAAAKAEIRGYNDEQAFQHDKGKDSYGSVVRIYAIHRQRSDAEYSRAKGAMVAVLEVEPDAAMDQWYKDLDIVNNGGAIPDVYCVFLFKINQGENPWKGGVSKFDGTKCADVKHKIDADVVPSSYQGVDDWPGFSARFTETKAGKPALGVRCLHENQWAWCEIGNGTNQSNGNSSNAGAAQGHNKGWHDDQILAEDCATPCKIKRSVTRASITPVPGLKGMSTEFQGTSGAHAATIYVDGPVPNSAKYVAMKLKGNSETEVWLRNLGGAGAWEAAFKTGTTIGGWISIPAPAQHQGLMPGTARWTWEPGDEGVWISCDQGCCEISQARLQNMIDSIKAAHPSGKPPATTRP